MTPKPSQEPPAQANHARLLAAEATCKDIGVRCDRIRARGAELFAAWTGSGPPLLLLHGLDSCFYTWRHLLRDPLTGRRVMAIDLPGFGASPDPPEHLRGQPGLNAILESLLQSLPCPAVICAHSIGSIAALTLAVSCPNLVQGLVLVAPATPGEPVPPAETTRNIMAMAYDSLDRLDSDIFAVYRKLRLRTPPEFKTISTFQKIEAPVPSTIPSLIVQGVADCILPRTDGLQRLLPHATVHQLENAGHCPHEEQPVRFRELMADFILLATT